MAEGEVVKVGLLGLGTVGSGVVTVLARNDREITCRAGRKFRLVHAAAKAYSADDIEGIDRIGRISDDAWLVVNDDETQIVIELIGGCHPAKELVLQAIANGKHVITANKALIATHGNELFAAAQRQGVIIAFEAAVAGGIPVIKILREGLVANRISWLAGIINGTGNYILTAMREEGKDFATALAEAQAAGYAEADPTYDVEGIDAAHKLAIMASIAFGIPLQFERVQIEGISDIQRQDVAYAEELGYRIKHLGIARCTKEGVEMRVHPTLIPHQCLLASVQGVMNALLVMSDALGPSLYYGAGAGSLPTASAVVADLVDVVRASTVDPVNRVPHLAFQPDALSTHTVLERAEICTAWYLRMQVRDRPGALAEITRILVAARISISAFVQKEPSGEAAQVPLIILTHCAKERQMDSAIAQMEALEEINGSITRIRVEALQ
ncbi:MAG: homoserine dehydrogenase [Candidatus Eutrophobiaceae bacterium]